MSAPYVTKPGKHGTLTYYAVEIIPADPGHAPYTVHRWAYSEDHAVERVTDAGDWCEEDRVGKVARVRQ